MKGNMTLASILVIIYLVFISWMVFQGKIMRTFNLADKRQFVSSEETYNKLNTLLANGDVSLYSHEFMDGLSVTLSISYSLDKTESSSNRFNTKSLDEAVNQAYDWSVSRGFIKE